MSGPEERPALMENGRATHEPVFNWGIGGFPNIFGFHQWMSRQGGFATKDAYLISYRPHMQFQALLGDQRAALVGTAATGHGRVRGRVRRSTRGEAGRWCWAPRSWTRAAKAWIS